VRVRARARVRVRVRVRARVRVRVRVRVRARVRVRVRVRVRARVTARGHLHMPEARAHLGQVQPAHRTGMEGVEGAWRGRGVEGRCGPGGRVEGRDPAA